MSASEFGLSSRLACCWRGVPALGRSTHPSISANTRTPHGRIGRALRKARFTALLSRRTVTSGSQPNSLCFDSTVCVLCLGNLRRVNPSPANDVRSVLAASDGTLWIGTAKGLVSWNHGKLTHYPQFDGNDVHNLLQQRDGTVWAAGTIWERVPLRSGAQLYARFMAPASNVTGRTAALAPMA